MGLRVNAFATPSYLKGKARTKACIPYEGGTAAQPFGPKPSISWSACSWSACSCVHMAFVACHSQGISGFIRTFPESLQHSFPTTFRGHPGASTKLPKVGGSDLGLWLHAADHMSMPSGSRWKNSKSSAAAGGRLFLLQILCSTSIQFR